MQTFIEVRVVDMRAQCTYLFRGYVRVASDICGQPATTAVVRPDGMQTWRCEQHKGLIEGAEQGLVRTSVKRRIKPQGRNIEKAEEPPKNILKADDGGWVPDGDL